MQDSGKPEDAGTASRKVREPRQFGEPSAGAKGARSRGNPKTQTRGKAGRWKRGETCKATTRRNWKCEAEGQPEAPAPEAPKDTRRGVTRGSVAGKAGRCRNRGNPAECIGRCYWRGEAAGETSSQRARGAEGCEFRGDSKIHRRQGRKMRKPGQPGGRIGRRNRRSEERGNLQFNSRKRQWTRETGQPETRSPAKPEDASCGATRNFIERRDWKSRAARLERQAFRRMRESRQLETPSRAQL
jgi:hypothetical protein